MTRSRLLFQSSSAQPLAPAAASARLGRIGLLAALLGLATTASAQSFYYAEVGASANALLGNFVQPPAAGLSRTGATPFPTLIVDREANATNASIGGFAGGSGAAWARTETAGVHLSTVASASVMADGFSTPNPNASGSSTALGQFRDVFQFVVPGVADNTPYTVSAQIRVDVSQMVNGLLLDTTAPSFFNATSSWQTDVTMASSSNSGWILEQRRQGSCQIGPGTGAMACTGSSPGLIDVSLMLYSGSRIVIDMSARGQSVAGAFLQGPGGASAGSSVDFGHTLGWGGVQQVRDAAGNLIDTYAMTGLGSGFDFRQAYVSAVPEPQTIALWAAGLAFMAALSGRRRKG